MEQHRSDYYKRLLKKVEDNLEKSKIRNKLLVNKADDLLQSVSVSNSNNLVKSKVKLEVAKVRNNFSNFLHSKETIFTILPGQSKGIWGIGETPKTQTNQKDRRGNWNWEKEIEGVYIGMGKRKES